MFSRLSVMFLLSLLLGGMGTVAQAQATKPAQSSRVPAKSTVRRAASLLSKRKRGRGIPAKEHKVPPRSMAMRQISDPAVQEEIVRINAPAEAVLNTARDAFQNGDLAQAEVAARKTIALRDELFSDDGTDPIRGQAQELIGRIRVAQGNYRAGLQKLLAAWKDYQRDESCQVEIAFCYLRLGDYAAARALYKGQYLDYKGGPRDGDFFPSTDTTQGLEANILLSRGACAEEGRRLWQALPCYQTVQRMVPNNGYVAYCVGEVSRKQDRLAEAKKEYALAARIGRGSYVQAAEEREKNLTYALEAQAQQAETMKTAGQKP